MAISATVEEFQQYYAKFEAKRGFDDVAATLGLSAFAADGESLGMKMPLTDALAQANGMFSAAAMFGAADITGTLLAMQNYADTGQFPLAVQSNQNFISNSKAAYAVATARLVRGGGSMAVVAAEVVDADGKLLMTSTFTYVVKERKLGR